MYLTVLVRSYENGPWEAASFGADNQDATEPHDGEGFTTEWMPPKTRGFGEAGSDKHFARTPRFAWSSSIAGVAGGSWRAGRRLHLDLSDLPGRDDGRVSLLDQLTDGRLDVVLQDDTSVSSARLSRPKRTCAGRCRRPVT
ncbi:MAG: hypothetical protein GY711_01980 [bacterium]|nr:hypothetical protein [bacterium]